MNNEESANKNGTVLIVVNIVLVGVWIMLRKASLLEINGKRLGIFGQQENYIYLALILILFGVNLYRMNQRSLFPALIAILVMTLTLVVR